MGNPVIGFVRKVLDYEGKFLTWLLHGNSAWENWVDSAIHDAFRLTYESYVTLTWDIANFSYFVGSFTAAARGWAEWLAYERIPHALRIAVSYTDWRVHKETVYRREAITRHWRMTVSLVTRVALTLGARINTEVNDRRAAIDRLRRILIAIIEGTALILQQHINAEIANRRAAIDNLRAFLLAVIAKLQAQVNAIIPFINKSAADGYNSTRKDQAGIIGRIADAIAADNPLVKDLVTRLAGLILDLAEVDNPVARVLAGTLLRELVNRIGVDKLAGGLAADLISELTGNGRAASLKDVAVSVGDRLNAGEAQWQQFYGNGGDDLENLGSQMRESSSLAFTVPLAAYFAGAVISPRATADATDAVVTPAVDAVLGPVIGLLGSL